MKKILFLCVSLLVLMASCAEQKESPNFIYSDSTCRIEKVEIEGHEYYLAFSSHKFYLEAMAHSENCKCKK